MAKRIGIGRVRRKQHRRSNRFELELDSRFLASLLNNRLGLLARRVDRSLKQQLQFLPIPCPYPVGSSDPSSQIENLDRFFNGELSECSRAVFFKKLRNEKS